ncbi:ATP-dependent acyl-CoA ligase [Rhodococcus zopfii]|uniref:ATP-dependent acyl-CoA ligase n=1 Tax=Rhodococcus zopfii TaxID=43772 RepID=A0ABU3WVF2_9NOCA|nr:ATP-dependent acyl-CoA ligase [Rhodococcus zopfii]
MPARSRSTASCGAQCSDTSSSIPNRHSSSPTASSIRSSAPPASTSPLVDLAQVRLDRTDAPTPTAPLPGTLASVLYTSGTTGPSKGVMLPHGYFSNFAAVLNGVLDLRPSDTCYFTMPFFHVDAHITVPLCLRTGSTFAFAPRFSASRFWSDAEEFAVTWFGAVGSMLSALLAQPQPAAPMVQRLRQIVAAPVPADAYTFFEDELGVPILQMYGQTEANGPLYSTLDRRRRGAVGSACAGFDVRVAGPDGREVPTGAVGELQIRPRHPHMITLGYWRRPQDTADAFRDLWFHTGDSACIDEEGFVHYRGRLTDSLRRRGENISAFELESVARSAPGVRDCAAVAVQDPLGGEDDIKLILVLDDPSDWNVSTFLNFCTEALPRFAVPRYLEIVDESVLVRGPGTGAIYKHLLPAGVTARTLDRTLLEP